VYVERNRDRIHSTTGPVGGSYPLDVPVDDIGPPPGDGQACAGRHDWAVGMGAVDADSTAGRMTSEGASDRVMRQPVGRHQARAKM
jgi:hypothetical protein